MTIKVIHDSVPYKIAERSLGFNWFFTFLAFVYFKSEAESNENKQNLFLLDEPASNLHSSAQEKLLSNFQKMVSDEQKSNLIIYTTHNQYLINPKWLFDTYIVKNEAITDEGGEDYTKPTNITLEKYSSFVGNHPDKKNHFQPVLDAIDYRPSELEMVDDVIMVEGKNDFYTLKYIAEHYSGNGKYKNLKILPGVGATQLSVPIQLYLAWGRNFVIFLDADPKGREAKERYIKEFGEGIVDKIYLLSDIDSKFSGALEKLFDKKEKMRIIKSEYPNEKRYKKDKFNQAIEILYATNKKVTLEKRAVWYHETNYCKI